MRYFYYLTSAVLVLSFFCIQSACATDDDDDDDRGRELRKPLLAWAAPSPDEEEMAGVGVGAAAELPAHRDVVEVVDIEELRERINTIRAMIDSHQSYINHRNRNSRSIRQCLADRRSLKALKTLLAELELLISNQSSVQRPIKAQKRRAVGIVHLSGRVRDWFRSLPRRARAFHAAVEYSCTGRVISV